MRLDEAIAALEQLGALCHAQVLTDAGELYTSRLRNHPQTVEQYVEEALEGEFDAYDQAFHSCRPSLVKHLEGYLNSHQELFILIEETR